MISTFAGKEPQTIIKQFCRKERTKNWCQTAKDDKYLQWEYGGGVDCMDENISLYVINLRTKKWWWPLFHFCIDVSINNAFQIYRERDLQLGEIKLDLLGFRRSIVETYFLLFHNKEAPSTLHRGNRSEQKKMCNERLLWNLSI